MNCYSRVFLSFKLLTSSKILIFVFFFILSWTSFFFLNFFSCLILSYFFIIFLAASLPDLLGFSIETGTFIVLDLFLHLQLWLFLQVFYISFWQREPLSFFLYFSLTFLAAICAFLSGWRDAISSNIFIVSARSSPVFGRSFLSVGLYHSLLFYFFSFLKLNSLF